jgi:hypothetical protein
MYRIKPWDLFLIYKQPGLPPSRCQIHFINKVFIIITVVVSYIESHSNYDANTSPMGKGPSTKAPGQTMGLVAGG